MRRADASVPMLGPDATTPFVAEQPFNISYTPMIALNDGTVATTKDASTGAEQLAINSASLTASQTVTLVRSETTTANIGHV
jgi:hypothetical protein